MPTLAANGIETYYERRGEGPPVVFVHASVMDHGMWDEQAETLSDGYTTVTYDLRGHGRTGGSSESAYTMALYAEDLRALVTGLDLERPVLVGLSMGGLVAATYAARYPDDVAGLVLADTFTPEIHTPGEWFLRRVLLPALVLPVRLVGYERLERLNVWVAERVASGSGGDYANVRRARADGPAMSTAEFRKVMRAMGRAHEHPLDLGAVTAPTLVLYGENELGFVRHHAAALAAALPDVRVEAVPDAGHASNLDNPEFFTDALRGFLADLRLGGVEGTTETAGSTGADGA